MGSMDTPKAREAFQGGIDARRVCLSGEGCKNYLNQQNNFFDEL